MKTEFEITPEILELFIESISRQTAAEPADDLVNKMGMLNEFCKGVAEAYADKVSRERSVNFLRSMTAELPSIDHDRKVYNNWLKEQEEQ